MTRNRNALLALSLSAGLVSGAALAADNNHLGGAAPLSVPVGSLDLNGGRFLCMAAINSNGSIATELEDSFIDHVNTHRLFGGTYQVAFNGPCGNVQIKNGWFRVIQPDTLTDGTLPARSCTVADRAGLPSALWIQCFDFRGNLVDTTFTVSVSR